MGGKKERGKIGGLRRKHKEGGEDVWGMGALMCMCGHFLLAGAYVVNFICVDLCEDIWGLIWAQRVIVGCSSVCMRARVWTQEIGSLLGKFC